MGLILHVPGPQTELFGITKDRVKREYSRIEEQLQWWARLPQHSSLELSGTPLDSFWARMEFGRGDVVAHNHFKLLKDAIVRVLEETAGICRDNGLLPNVYMSEASWLLTGLIESVYRDMIYLEAEARRVRQVRESQARRFTAPSQQPEKARSVHEIAQGLMAVREFEIVNGTRALTHFLAEQVRAFLLLASRAADPESGPDHKSGDLWQSGKRQARPYVALDLAERSLTIGDSGALCPSDKIWEFLKELADTELHDAPLLKPKNWKSAVTMLRRKIGKEALWVLIDRTPQGYGLGPAVAIKGGGQLGIRKTRQRT